jgi:hypothetical protein
MRKIGFAGFSLLSGMQRLPKVKCLANLLLTMGREMADKGLEFVPFHNKG